MTKNGTFRRGRILCWGMVWILLLLSLSGCNRPKRKIEVHRTYQIVLDPCECGFETIELDGVVSVYGDSKQDYVTSFDGVCVLDGTEFAFADESVNPLYGGVMTGEEGMGKWYVLQIHFFLTNHTDYENAPENVKDFFDHVEDCFFIFDSDFQMLSLSENLLNEEGYWDGSQKSLFLWEENYIRMVAED